MPRRARLGRCGHYDNAGNYSAIITFPGSNLILS